MIEAQGLTRKYGGALAVDGLSFSVRPGQVTAFIGPNGAGKSTALRMMLQLERGRGRTYFSGRRYRELRHPAREVGAWLGTEPAYPRRRARTELRVLAAAHGIRRARVDEVLDLVGLTPVAGVRVGSLSSGARGRLGLAGALLGDPHTLVLDEPSAGQDPEGARWIREFLRAYATQGRTVLVAGHGLSELTDCADRVLAVARGRLVADESAGEYRSRAEGHEVYVRTPQVDRLSELLRREGLAVHAHGGTVLTVSGADRARVGEIAFRGNVLMHELAQREISVADAFCAVTARSRASAAEHATLALLADAARRPSGRAGRKLLRRRAEAAGPETVAMRMGYDHGEGISDDTYGVCTDAAIPAPAAEVGTPANTGPSAAGAAPGGHHEAAHQASHNSTNSVAPASGSAYQPDPEGRADHAGRAGHRRPKHRRWLSRGGHGDQGDHDDHDARGGRSDEGDLGIREDPRHIRSEGPARNLTRGPAENPRPNPANPTADEVNA
ncbi:ABC transporter ATP-binding protein [Yinghuangia sp. YIM S09857]|uniref:ABC transporter ATP-binding protein n=1 Tax=Yinghuangia sp. YIM S09857 TaxID=3436929 RepID=UPI003F52FDF5